MEHMRKQLLKFIETEHYVADVYKVGSFGFPPNYSYHNHKHPEIEIFYIVDGYCKMSIGEEVVTLQQGESIVIYPNVEHRFSVSPDGTCYISQLEFRQELPSAVPEEAVFFRELRDGTVQYAKIAQAEKIGLHIEEIAKKTRLQSAKDDGNKLARLSLDLLFLQLFIVLSQEIEAMRQSERAQDKDKYQKAILFINENYMEQITIGEICEDLGVSSRYIRRRFREDLGMTSSQYISLLRISKAKEYLSTFHHSITDIAFMTGFTNSQYFSRVFKEHTELSPSEYRNMLTEDTKPIK